MSQSNEVEGIIKAFDRSKNSVFNEHGLDILVVKNYEDTKIPSLAAYDVIILDYHNPTRANELLQLIRASVYEEVYLKPVFLLAYDKKVNAVDNGLADGVLAEQSITNFLSRIEKILKSLEEIQAIKSDFTGSKIQLKLLRYLYCREVKLTPIPSRNSLTGYAFPFVDANIQQFEYEEAVDMLVSSVERGYLSADFIDYSHLCSNCLSGFINYRETCPKCGSRKHVSQHTIHHFVCGYVGPETDFHRKNHLVCPKCDRQLRHIGVDYDKPSLVSECEKGHIFQEPHMKTFCYACHQEAELSELFEYAINEYALTASGANVAVSGSSKKKEENMELDGFVSLSVFKTFLKVEIQRQKATHNSSSVTYLNLMLAPATLKKHQNDFGGFSANLAMLMKNQLQPTEIVSFLNDDVFLILTPESSVQETSDRFAEISQSLLTIVKNNFGGNEQDKVFYETFEMDVYHEADSILEKINEKINIF